MSDTRDRTEGERGRVLPSTERLSPFVLRPSSVLEVSP